MAERKAKFDLTPGEPEDLHRIFLTAASVLEDIRVENNEGADSEWIDALCNALAEKAAFLLLQWLGDEPVAGSVDAADDPLPIH